MQLFPAIDLLDGRVVRLVRGDYNAVTVYNSDPVAQAQAFAEAGAEWLHVVDLDGAQGQGKDNRAVIARIIAGGFLKVQTGGGVRSMKAIEALVELGASRIVLGTSLVTDPQMASAAIDAFGDLICAGVDARNGRVAISGWQTDSDIKATELARSLAEQGVRHFLYTDINRDGLQTGIDVDAYRRLSEACGCSVIASGGIASLDDLRALRQLGDGVIEGVIVGRALYEQSFSVQSALNVLCG